MIDEARLRTLLVPFRLDLSPHQALQTLTYLQLLLRWNEKINLTAIRDADLCVTRLFGESLFLINKVNLDGTLLDIGSGAGFPGLALKIVFPELLVTLLEPVAKKRAFLKEATRVCNFSHVTVCSDRLEYLAATAPSSFDSATMRAVGNLDVLVPLAAKCLSPAGRLLLWLTQEQAAALPALKGGFDWMDPLTIPLSRFGQVWQGVKR